MQERGYLHQAEARLKWATVKRNSSLSARLRFQDNYTVSQSAHRREKQAPYEHDWNINSDSCWELASE